MSLQPVFSLYNVVRAGGTSADRVRLHRRLQSVIVNGQDVSETNKIQTIRHRCKPSVVIFIKRAVKP